MKQTDSTNGSGILENGRITFKALSEFKNSVIDDLKQDGMMTLFADQSVNRSNPNKPTTSINFYGEYKIEDFETVKMKMMEYGQELVLDVTGYDENCQPSLASYSISIMTMQH